jgi:hypothetical protein
VKPILSISGITITGTNSGDFGQINACGKSLSGGANCTIDVTFKPTATGARVGTLRISDDVGIPVKVTSIPEGSRTAFRSEGEQQSERSDADTVIVKQVFGIVKQDGPKRSGGGSAGLGVRERGSSPFAPASSL